jgi:hypothetical protein
MIFRPPITRDGAQHDARRELSKAIYHRSGDPWPVRALHWFSHLLGRLLSATARHAPAGDVGALALVVVIVALIGLVIWRVGVPRRTPASEALFADVSRLTAADHRALADAAAARGDWHAAVVERMRAIARELEERGVVDDRPGRTATEVAAQAGVQLPDHADRLRAAASTFNDVAYGEAPAGPAQVAVLVAADEVVRRDRRAAVLVA